MMAALKLVEQVTRAAPYDSLVSAKGWRFELDYEQIDQSDTWALAEPEIRPWLIMMWLTAWKQRPCGSLPNSDELIAARMGMKLNQFRANREILLRGWWLADDGRLYHQTLTDQVLRMVGAKVSERDRKRAWREAQKNQGLGENVPEDVQGTDGRVPRTSTVRDATGTGTGTGTGTIETPESPIGDSSTAPADRPDALPCPRVEIIAAYHRLLPMLPEIVEWTPARAKALRTRWRESPKRQSIRWWERFFTYIGESKFLTGRADPKPGNAPFVADIDFILRPSKFVAIIEGKYHGGNA